MSNIFDIFKRLESERAENALPVSFIVAGLGNPGKKYENTRHNAGFLALSHIAKKEGFSITASKFSSLYADVRIDGKRGIFLLPQTMMNNSGLAIAECANFYKISPENVLVVFDDISLDVGRMRIRKKGSHGGHNGIKSITAHLGTDAFPRIKIGVGQKPSPEYDLVSWVLGNFSEQDKAELEKTFSCVHDAVKLIISGQTEKAENLYNGK